MFPLVRKLHETIRKHSAGKSDYKRYFDSLKNSVLTSFYTPPVVVQAIASALATAGVKPDRLLDPSAGTGVFADAFASEADGAETLCFEKDLITGKILAKLQSLNDHDVTIDGFQKIDKAYNDHFDVVASNIPFGDTKVYDAAFDRSDDQVRKWAQSGIHNYFFLKGVDMLRDGGVLAFITSQGVMDSPRNEPIRKWLMERCRLVSAIRLPSNLFIDSAGTEVGSDLIVLQKNNAKTEITTSVEEDLLTSVKSPEGPTVNKIFLNHPERIVHTESKLDTDPYGQPAYVYKHTGGIEGIAADLRRILEREIGRHLDTELYLNGSPKPPAPALQPVPEIIPEPTVDPGLQRLELFESESVFGAAAEASSPESRPVQRRRSMTTSRGSVFDMFGGDLFSQPPQKELTPEEQAEIELQERVRKEQAELKKQKALEPRPYTGKIQPFYKNGTLVAQDGQYGYLKSLTPKSAMFHPLEISMMQRYRAEAYIPLRDTYQQLYRLEGRNEMEYKGLRKKLNRLYQTFSTTIGDLNAKDNAQFIMMDATGREVLALERFEKGRKVKADIFERPVSYNPNEVTHVDTAQEALLASVNKYGVVNLKYMSSLSDIAPDALIEELEGRIYFNPMVKGYEITDRFIAGNVVKKAE